MEPGSGRLILGEGGDLRALSGPKLSTWAKWAMVDRTGRGGGQPEATTGVAEESFLAGTSDHR